MASPSPADVVERLRYPHERAALALAMGSDAAVLALAVVVLVMGERWIPGLHHRVAWFRAVAIAGLLALPTAQIMRHIRLFAARGDGVRVGRDQFPELYAELERNCRKLDIHPVPHLYLSKTMTESSSAHSIVNGPDVVLLNANLFTGTWKPDIDSLSFLMARALGALRLGHTRWWVEVCTSYTRKIPALRGPLLMSWAFSRDRCAAYAVPNGFRGLLHEAVGKHLSGQVDVRSFVRQTARARGIWRFVAGFVRKEPLVTTRARSLFEHGFFQRALADAGCADFREAERAAEQSIRAP